MISRDFAALYPAGQMGVVFEGTAARGAKASCHPGRRLMFARPRTTIDRPAD